MGPWTAPGSIIFKVPSDAPDNQYGYTSKCGARVNGIFAFMLTLANTTSAIAGDPNQGDIAFQLGLDHTGASLYAAVGTNINGGVNVFAVREHFRSHWLTLCREPGSEHKHCREWLQSVCNRSGTDQPGRLLYR